MSLHHLNGRVVKLEHQAAQPVDYARIPAAQRQARIHALLLKNGVAQEDVALTLERLRAMSPAERVAWVKGV